MPVVDITAEAGVIGVVSVNIGRIWAADGDHDIVENGDRISGQNLRAVAAKRDVGDEIKLTVASRRVKFQRRISRERAAADIEHAVSAKHAALRTSACALALLNVIVPLPSMDARNVPLAS